MKIIITESQHRYLSEQGPLGRAIGNGFEKGAEWLLKLLSKEEGVLAKSIAVKTLPREVEILISKLPVSVTVAEKLGQVLEKNITKIKSLHGNISRLNNITGKGMGIAEMLANKLEKQMSTPKGHTVNLQDMVETSNRLEVELMNIKKSLPKPNNNDLKKINDWYNFLYTELSDIKNINSDFNELLKNTKFK